MKKFFGDRRGTIDQAITSVIVLFAVFFLMAIFVIVSGNIGKITGTNSEAQKAISGQVDSRVLTELFLSDEITVGGERILINEAIKKMVFETDDDKISDIGKAIKEKFHDDYSCGKSNHLFVVYEKIKPRSVSDYIIYIDYPNNYEKRTPVYNPAIKLPSDLPPFVPQDGAFLKRVYENIKDITEKEFIIVYVKENRKC